MFVYYIVLSSMKEINVKDYTIGTYLQHTCCFCSRQPSDKIQRAKTLPLCVAKSIIMMVFNQMNEYSLQKYHSTLKE